ncbi:hypothetical protein HPB51_008177 [Rhipicephalus microplus]|uniref:Uncharacterized protein n=1 Tax=Rhipicephalus microplus TaxID=6941 RepID=A0A9J6E8F4_RHIMP|nr:hypothetical protein HPB51_008177 [Rhipicephalus microplus]
MSRVAAQSMRVVPLLWCRQLFVILWKNVYLKRICRHYLLTVFEVAFMVTMLLGIQEDAVVREPLIRRGDTLFGPIGYMAFWNTQPDLAHIDTVRRLWRNSTDERSAQLAAFFKRSLC